MKYQGGHVGAAAWVGGGAEVGHEGQQAHLGPFGEWKVCAKKTNWTEMGPVCLCDRFLLGGVGEKVAL